jgi:hypothetical protein
MRRIGGRILLVRLRRPVKRFFNMSVERASYRCEVECRCRWV